jgi:hypothetical protein
MLGTMADSVLQATVVLPNGQVVTASASSEPDLFWVSSKHHAANAPCLLLVGGGLKCGSLCEAAAAKLSDLCTHKLQPPKQRDRSTS